MTFVTVAYAGRYADLAGTWHWAAVPVYTFTTLTGSALLSSATLRLTANGYPQWIRRLYIVIFAVALLLTFAFVNFRYLTDGANFWLAGLPITGAVALGTAAMSLAAAWLLPPRMAKSVGGPRPRRHHYRRWIPVLVVLYLLSAAHTWQEGARRSAVLTFIGGAAVAVMLFTLERRYRSQLDAEAALARRGSVLLLRSFTRDLFGQDEALLAKEVRRQLGDFMALGNPREVLPAGRATRLYLPDGAWRAQLTVLAGQSRAIVMWPDTTPAVRWELGMVRDCGLRDRLFVIVPPPPRRRTWLGYPPGLLRYLSGLGLPDWSEFTWALQEEGFGSPERDPGPGAVLAFGPDGQCTVLARGLPSTRALVARIAGQLAGLDEPVRPTAPSA